MAFLDPFTEEERYLIEPALAALAGTHFFERFAKQLSLELVDRFDSMSQDERLVELNQLTGTRRTLLSLGMESMRIAESMGVMDSDTEPGDSTNDAEESLESILGS